MNIIQRIGREISREMGINPNGSTKEREKYNKIKIKLRGNAATVILNNPDLSKKLEKIIKRKKFKWSTQIGNHKKWGPRFAKASKWIKKRRNL
ncbi:MAG: hypothetical protein COT90_00755 [Candidatus Diapherotrites archaeon CG10_big_fil_rev_8_21_14_0_10_31_34]|nr:MAG: hypothetical protein COT90_00755 [Candidatus Diapherotrites archaeon CG10_big_fil_rev_8_21_14_0_10_31_34]